MEVSPMHDVRFVTPAELDVLQRDGKSVVVAFVATWNGRCQAFAAGYRLFADDCDASLSVVCVDVDECTALTAAYEVCSLPTIIVLRAGTEMYRHVGIDLDAVRACLQLTGTAPRVR
jgi:thioredoxin-like negative regulator of GroEL